MTEAIRRPDEVQGAMHRDELLALYDREMRIEADVPRQEFRHERIDAVVRIVGPSPAAHDNYVLFSRLDAESADVAIRRQIADFRSLGHSFEWKVHEHDTPADLSARLLRHGLTADAPETVMVRAIQEPVPGRLAACSIDVRRIDQPAQLSDLVAVQDEVWKEDHAWYGAMLADELAADSTQIEILVAYDGRRPVATSLLRLHRGTQFASIWGAATLPAYRGRGIYTQLVDRHTSTARTAGARLLTADANADSRPVLEGIGFRPLVGVQGFVWRRAG
jgi:GNAT superfamily N-acetyltransferase